MVVDDSEPVLLGEVLQEGGQHRKDLAFSWIDLELDGVDVPPHGNLDLGVDGHLSELPLHFINLRVKGLPRLNECLILIAPHQHPLTILIEQATEQKPARHHRQYFPRQQCIEELSY